MYQLKIEKMHNHCPDYEVQLKEKGFINQIQQNQHLSKSKKY